MKQKILILGKGFIGQRLGEVWGCPPSARKIRTFEDAWEEVEKYNPEVIINCIGYTGKRNVDDCELDKDKTLLSNTFVPLILGEVALRKKIKLVHISSGCIYQFDYSQEEPIKEEKIPDFFHLFYSRSKIYAERALEVLSKEFDIPFVYGATPHKERKEIIQNSVSTIVSSVGKEGLSLQDIKRTITYNFLFGSRREETQFFGRLLHGKDKGEHIIMMTDEEYGKYGKRIYGIQGKGFRIRVARI